MPSPFFSRHDQDRLTPIRKDPRRFLSTTPPEPGLRWHFTSPHPDPGEDCLESSGPFTDTEVEHLHLRQSEDGMLTPVLASIRTFRVTLHYVVFMVRSSDVPHLPFAIVVDKIGFVD